MRGVAARWTALVLALVAGAGEGQELRDCPAPVFCTGASIGDPVVRLDCAPIGARVGAVESAGVTFVDEIAQVCGGGEWNATCSVQATEQCRLVVEKVNATCFGQPACEVDVAAELESCLAGLCAEPGALSLSIQTQCSSPPDMLGIAITVSVIMVGLALGSSVTPQQVEDVRKKHLRGLLVGYFSQVLFMPIFSLLLALAFQVNSYVGISMVILGASPGGSSSNLCTYFAKGNVALSIIMSTASLVLVVGSMPFWVWALGLKALNVEAELGIPFMKILEGVLLATLPPIAGLLLSLKFPRFAKVLERVGTLLGLGSYFASFYIGVSTNLDLMEAHRIPSIWIAAAFYQPVGSLVGYALARLWRLPRPEARAVSMETGIQNLGLAIALISLTYTGCTRRQVLAFPLVAGIMWLFNCLWITLLMRYVMAPCDTPEEKASRMRKEVKFFAAAGGKSQGEDQGGDGSGADDESNEAVEPSDQPSQPVEVQLVRTPGEGEGEGKKEENTEMHSVSLQIT